MKAEIIFENNQDKIETGDNLRALIERVVDTVLAQEAFPHECEVSVLFVDDEEIRLYNHEHRGIDRATDVLSFPMLEYDEGGEIISEDVGFGDVLLLGDIVLSLERAKVQAEDYGHSFEREVGFLCAHSVLHLLGYDHEDDEESRLEMREKEEKALSALELVR